MINLFFDFETTGVWDKNKPPGHPEQPYAVSVAAILADDDREVGRFYSLCKPERPCGPIEIPEGAEAIHGISTDMADVFGLPQKAWIAVLYRWMKLADRVIGHNVLFDCNLMQRELLSIGREDKPWEGKTFCTMLATTNVCCIPSEYKQGDFKWPKLIEAYRHFFGEEFDGAHDSLADTAACMRVYFAYKAWSAERDAERVPSGVAV